MLATAREIFNDGWRGNWGFTPITETLEALDAVVKAGNGLQGADLQGAERRAA